MEINIKITSPEETETAFILTRALMEYHNALDIFTMTQQRFKELIESHALMSYIAYIDGKAAGLMKRFLQIHNFFRKKNSVYRRFICP